jgi:hypothetical protein
MLPQVLMLHQRRVPFLVVSRNSQPQLEHSFILFSLHFIPGIWFPYGVGISRGQFFFAAFVFVMFVILIQKNGKEKF